MLFLHSTRLIAHSLFAGAVIVVAMSTPCANAQGVNISAFDKLKGLETTFPFPAITATIEMGTFDAQSGVFEGLTGTPARVLNPGASEPRIQEATPARKEINAVNTVLLFKIKSGTGQVNVNGTSQPISPGRDVMVSVTTQENVRWSITSGTRFYRDWLRIERPAVIGAGVFTVPAVPVALIYDPPQNRGATNAATYSSSKAMTTTTTAGWSTQDSNSSPATTGYASLMDLKSEMSNLSSALGKVPNPYAQAVSVALGVFANGLGDADAIATQSVSRTTENVLVLSTQSGTSYTTTSHTGPGAGDNFIVVQNARMVWLGTVELGRTRVRLALLGWDGVVTTSAQALKIDREGWRNGGAGFHPVSGLDATTIDNLLALDPFVSAGATAVLSGPRFKFVENHTLAGCGCVITFNVSDTVTQTDVSATASVSSMVTQYSPGWLSFMGFGVTESGTTATSQTYTASKAVTLGTTVGASVSLATDLSESYVVDIYRDLVFGAFAVRLAPSGPPRLEGVARLRDGKLLANAKVAVFAKGRQYSTFTDAKGRYAFRAVDMPAGKAMLRYGAIKQTVEIGAPGRPPS